MFEKSGDWQRRREKPDLIRQDHQIEIFVPSQGQGLQRGSNHLGRFGKGIEEAEETPRKRIGLDRTQGLDMHCKLTTLLQWRHDALRDLGKLSGLRVRQHQNSLDRGTDWGFECVQWRHSTVKTSIVDGY